LIASFKSKPLYKPQHFHFFFLNNPFPNLITLLFDGEKVKKLAEVDANDEANFFLLFSS